MKLLPCPFCGGEPEEDGGMFFEFYGHERQDYSIACKKCRAEVRCDVGEHEGADAPCSCHHDTRKICAEKWNRRAAMLHGAEPVTTAYKLRDAVEIIRNSGIEIDSGKIKAERDSLNSPVIPDGWVACSERMPKKNDKVLIFIDFNSKYVPPSIHDAEFTGSTFRRGGATVNVYPLEDGYGVTHWQPLPSPPAK